MVTQKQRRLWAFFAALACIMWGISGLFAKSLFNTSPSITPMWLSQIRMVTSGIILLIVAGFLKQKPIATMKNKHDALVIIAYGIFGLLPVQLFYFIVVQQANASIATILQFIGPFFVMAYLAFTHKQVMRRIDVIAAILSTRLFHSLLIIDIYLTVFFIKMQGNFLTFEKKFDFRAN